MALTLKQSGLVVAHKLTLKDGHIEIMDGSFSRTKVRYDDIDSVLLSSRLGLSLTWGTRGFSIAADPKKPKVRQFLDALLERVRAAH